MRFAWQIGVLLVFLSKVCVAQSSDYEKYLNEGLRAEGMGSYPDAVNAYLKALQADPKSRTPKDRIFAIFKEMRSKRKPTTELEVLLPLDVRDELVAAKILRSDLEHKEAAEWMTIVFWGFVALALVLAMMVSIWIYGRIQKSREEKAFSTRQSQSTKQTRPVKSDTGPVAKRETKITEKTRQEMTNVITGVKSITSAQPRPDLTPPEELQKAAEALQSSEVVSALAGTLVSEVATDQTETGKFSKLSLDGTMLFDESDLPPDLDEYRKAHGDEGIEKYLEQLAAKEAKKDK